jgi:hypothetical protein
MATASTVGSSALTHNVEHRIATSLFGAAAVMAILFPGAVLGALLAKLVWRATRPPIVSAWLFGGMGAATAAVLRSAVAMAWPVRLIVHALYPGALPGVSIHAIAASVPVEALVGPLLLVTFELGTSRWRRTIQGQEAQRTRDVTNRKKALERHWNGPGGDTISTEAVASGRILLGIGAEDRQPFEIGLHELDHHVFLPGASGSGKTTTIARLTDGAMANGYGVVIIDCKGEEARGRQSS